MVNHYQGQSHRGQRAPQHPIPLPALGPTFSAPSVACHKIPENGLAWMNWYHCYSPKQKCMFVDVCLNQAHNPKIISLNTYILTS